MVARTCGFSYLWSWGRRILWTQVAEVAVSWDCTTALQPGDRVRLYLKKKKKKVWSYPEPYSWWTRKWHHYFIAVGFSSSCLPLLLPFLLLCSPVWLPTSLWPSPKSKAQVPQAMAVQTSTLKECSELSVELQGEDMEKSFMWTTSGRQVG